VAIPMTKGQIRIGSLFLITSLMICFLLKPHLISSDSPINFFWDLLTVSLFLALFECVIMIIATKFHKLFLGYENSNSDLKPDPVSYYVAITIFICVGTTLLCKYFLPFS